ncbi:MAG: 8-oxo-dGTP diphosphatase [Alphaproteobacteria bacterium]|jgi:8-oxo-dGTP diphosphatase
MTDFIKLPWLQHPHKAKQIIGEAPANPGDISASFIFAFKGEEILMAQVYSRGWELPGGHRENAETSEEAVSRELFEECGTSAIMMGELGHLEITLDGDKPPQPYPYPFPTSYLMFYWGIVDHVGAPSSSMEVGEPKFFNEKDARKLDSIKNNIFFYEDALQRAKIVAEKMAQLDSS